MTEVLPRPQPLFWNNDFERSIYAGLEHHATLWKKTGIDPLSLKNIVQLGPGVGVDLGIFLQVFPNAAFQVIDYHDVLHPILKGNSRIKFYQGLFTEVLAETPFSDVDLTVMNSAGSTHGFTEDTIQLLHKLVGSGYFLTSGENGLFEGKSWFDEQFSMVQSLDPGLFGTTLWKGR